MKEKILADFHRKRAGRVIENMKRRNIDGAYFPDRRGAISHICGLIPAGPPSGWAAPSPSSSPGWSTPFAGWTPSCWTATKTASPPKRSSRCAAAA